MHKFLMMLLLAFALATHLNANPSPLPEFPFVTVTGESSRNVTPDMVEISFYVEAFAEQSDKATQLQYTVMQQALDVLLEAGITAEQITSMEISKSTIRQRDEDYNELAILGYEVGQPVTVTLNSLEKYADITAKLIEIDMLSNIESEFDVKQRETIELELVKEAGAQAQHRAEQLTKGLGVDIDSVYGISEGSGFPSFFASFGTNYELMSASGRRMAREQMFFIPKTIEITKQINVIYKITNIHR